MLERLKAQLRQLLKSRAAAPRPSICLTVLFCFFFSLAVASVAPAQSSQTPYIPKPAPRLTVVLPEANRTPDANEVMEMREQRSTKQHFDIANAERMRQLMADADLLVKLAKELRLETRATPNAALTPSQIRKAEDIERLARNVQVKMKLTVGTAN